MCRGKPRHNSGEQGNEQQTPGTMLTGHKKGPPASLLSCADSWNLLAHNPLNTQYRMLSTPHSSAKIPQLS